MLSFKRSLLLTTIISCSIVLIDAFQRSERCSSRAQSVAFARREPSNSKKTNTCDRRLALLGIFTTVSIPSQATAYNKEFPSELDTENAYADGREKKLQDIREREYERTAPVALGPWSEPLGAGIWGAALWLLTGSRSNPLINPLANVLYDETKEEWLKDRNEGLFSNVPVPLYVIIAVVFIGLGLLTDNFITQLAEGERNISLQLAGVSLISGASLELGRIASGEKKQTREESDRDVQLVREFEEFAEKRLQRGGNVHRNEVVAAFRRYYAKYRQPDNPEYPLVDLEIEQLLRSWSRIRGIEMSSAGFYNGVQINTQADAFSGKIR